MTTTMPVQPEWMKVVRKGLPSETVPASEKRVDRDSHVIRGYVVAEEGEMKDGRGHFSRRSIEKLIEIGQSAGESGAKMRFQHPDSSDDGLGKYLGRGKNFRAHESADGRLMAIADAHLSEASSVSPSGDLRNYVETLAEEAPDQFGTSIVGKFDWFDAKGRKLDRSQMLSYWDEMPGVVEWIPNELHASDVVAEGNAVQALFPAESLSALPDGLVHQASAGLDQLFAGQPREVVETRCMAFLKRYVDNRYGAQQMSTTETKPAGTETNADVKPDEKLQTTQAPADQPVTPVAPAAAPTQPAEKLSKSREVEILEVCQIAGCPEHALSYIQRSELSAGDVKDLLFRKLSHERELSAGKTAPSDSSSFTATSEEEQLKAKVHEDFLQNHDLYEQMGVTEANLLATAQREAAEAKSAKK